MRVSVHAPEVAKRHRDFLTQRFEAALRRFGDFVEDARVRLSDENGPRGGRDQACLVTVSLQTGQRVVVHERRADPMEAAAHAIRRVKRALGERINARAKRRQSARGVRHDDA